MDVYKDVILIPRKYNYLLEFKHLNTYNDFQSNLNVFQDTTEIIIQTNNLDDLGKHLLELTYGI